jgi:flagellar hook protein FlgE
VTGYKQQRVDFDDVLSQTLYGAAKASGKLGSLNPMSMPMGGSRISAIKTDFSQGLLAESTRQTDLGINGEGFFILSKTPTPTNLGDLVFTRDGSFRLDYVVEVQSGTQTTGKFRLVNQEGMFVMGIQGQTNTYRDGAANLPGFALDPPAFRRSLGDGAAKIADTSLTNGQSPTSPDFQSYLFKPIEVEQVISSNAALARNTNISDETIRFDERGGLLVNGDVTTDMAGKKTPVFVALAKFQSREGLARTSSGSLFSWTPAAGGDLFLGAAGSRVPTGNAPVAGAGNTADTLDVGFDGTQVLGRRLEASNSSVNTTLPEMTIAQKSFTASVKIIQVGNALIDDVNNLVR